MKGWKRASSCASPMRTGRVSRLGGGSGGGRNLPPCKGGAAYLVIPAKARISGQIVIPAKAGISGREVSAGLHQTPAFAGVTGGPPPDPGLRRVTPRLDQPLRPLPKRL